MLKYFSIFKKNILTILFLIALLGIFCVTQKVEAVGFYSKKIDFNTLSSSNGAYPYGFLTTSTDGTKLYGITHNGGLTDKGTIFEYNITDNTYTKKIDINNENGTNLKGSLTLSADGSILYGAAYEGGANGIGTIFEYNITDNTYTKKIDLNDQGGYYPQGSLTLSSDGKKLYGLTSGGGENGRGTLFEYDIANNTYTDKLDLRNNPANGSLTLSSDGKKLYGISYEGGSNFVGTLFEYDIANNTYSQKVEFDEINGAKPQGSLTLSDDGTKLYGMTTAGGVNGAGTIFEYNISTGVYTKKIDLSDVTGSNPQGSLTLSADGTILYGMTYSGGEDKKGTIFEYNINTGVFTKKVDLNSISGSHPVGSLTLSTNGTKLYGVTSEGGENYTGTLFEYDINQNSFPSVTSVSISGNVSVGEVLTASYIYSDSDSDPEGQSIFKWYRAGVIIPGANSVTYTITTEDLGKSIQFEVTPVASSGELTGLAMRSNFLPIGIPILTTGSSEVRTYDFYDGGWPILLNGSVNYLNEEDQDFTMAGFEYGTNQNYGEYIDAGPTLTDFRALLFLETCGIYHYRAYTANSFGTGYGEDKIFEVKCPTAPSLTTGESEPVVELYTTDDYIILFGTITSDGGLPGRMSTGFQYGLDTNYGSEAPTDAVDGTGLFMGVIYGNFTCNETYHYRSYATNAIGTGYGNDATFYIPCPAAPTILTGTAEPLSLTSVSINSNLTSNGSDSSTFAGIEYGTDINYGLFSKTLDIAEPSSQFDTDLQNLSCDVTYHYRSYATNTYGTGYGDDATFTIPCTQAFSYIKRFDFNGVATGYMPRGTLVLSPDNKKLYGMTRNADTSSHGAIFQYDIASSTFTKIIDLGGEPGESLVLSADGSKFYGLTNDGGSGKKGSIFEYNIASSTYTKKIDLNTSIGSYPNGYLTLSLDGTKLYGMTKYGGANDLGVIFEYDITNNTYIKKIDLSNELGINPWGSLTLSRDGTKLYGMTNLGGENNKGTIFEYDTTNNTYTKKFDFSYYTGNEPQGNLTLSSDGTKLYGLANKGGQYSSGSLFEFNLSNNIYTDDFSFDYRNSDGVDPTDSLTLSQDGTKFYGTAEHGGTYSGGVLFEYIIATNTYNKIKDLRSIIGSGPIGSVTLSNDNKLYGMTQYGGANNDGTIFEYDMSKPSLIAVTASSITMTSATLNGEIANTGGANPSKRGFQYGLDTKYGTSIEDTGTFSSGIFNSNISDLTCSTVYHFRSYATSDFGTSYGFDQTLTTRDCPKPISIVSGTSLISLPPAIGNGKRQSSISMNSSANIGSVENGVNILGYINSQANFTVPNVPPKPAETHNLTISNLDLAQNVITITISSKPQTITLKKGESREVDLDGDNKNEITVTFTDVYVNRAEITVKSIPNSTLPLSIAPVNTVAQENTSLKGSTMSATSTISSPSITPEISKTKKYNFKKDLKLSMSSADVKELQKYLNANGFIVTKSGVGSKGKESTFFGPATKAALIKFQKAKKIYPAIGYFGSITRGIINK